MTSVQRTLGSFERLFYRYSQRNPLHFSLVAEFPLLLSAQQVSTALRDVQKRHAILTAGVRETPFGVLEFVVEEPVRPIPVRVVADRTVDWNRIAAQELAQPFDRTTAPLMRATLVVGVRRSAVLLTFDHTIADGISAALIIDDFVSALNGTSLQLLPFPPSQEQMLARTRETDIAEAPPAEIAIEDVRLSQASAIRQFDRTLPVVVSAALDQTDTTALIGRCREQQSTVHSALVVAASRAWAQGKHTQYARVLSPIDFRGLIGNPQDCADYFMAARTGMAPLDGIAFWDQARSVHAQLSELRSRRGIEAASQGVQAMVPPDIDADGAEQFLIAGLSHDLTISNLGVRQINSTQSIRPDALWGPVLLNQIAGETVTGVVTFEGRLRMTMSSYWPAGDFLDAVVKLLRAAITEPEDRCCFR